MSSRTHYNLTKILSQKHSNIIVEGPMYGNKKRKNGKVVVKKSGIKTIIKLKNRGLYINKLGAGLITLPRTVEACIDAETLNRSLKKEIPTEIEIGDGDGWIITFTKLYKNKRNNTLILQLFKHIIDTISYLYNVNSNKLQTDITLLIENKSIKAIEIKIQNLTIRQDVNKLLEELKIELGEEQELGKGGDEQ